MMMVNFHPLHGVLIDGAISLMACKSPPVSLRSEIILFLRNADSFVVGQNTHRSSAR